MLFLLFVACAFAEVTVKCDRTKVKLEGSGIFSNYKGENCPEESAITEIEIGNEVTFLAQNVFSNAKALTNLTIGNGVTEVDIGAFRNVNALTILTIGSGLTKIGDNCFYYIDKKDAEVIINIPKNVKTIGRNVFQNATGITEFNLEGDGTVIGDQFCEYAENLKKVTLAGKITKLGNNVFQQAMKVEGAELTISAEVGEIGDQFCLYAEKLKNIKIEGKIKKIGNNGFKLATKTTKDAELTITSDIDEIGNEFFQSAEGLKIVKIEGTIKKIGSNPFQDAKNLEKFTYKGESPQCISNNKANWPKDVDVDIKNEFCNVDASFGTLIMMFAMILFFLF